MGSDTMCFGETCTENLAREIHTKLAKETERERSKNERKNNELY
jgi:hypothetical protein